MVVVVVAVGVVVVGVVVQGVVQDLSAMVLRLVAVVVVAVKSGTWLFCAMHAMVCCTATPRSAVLLVLYALAVWRAWMMIVSTTWLCGTFGWDKEKCGSVSLCVAEYIIENTSPHISVHN